MIKQPRFGPLAPVGAPPGAFKDWTEAHQGGMNLRRWWSDRLNGNDSPVLFCWEDLAQQRWGSAAESVRGNGTCEDLNSVVSKSAGGDVFDEYAIEERQAIRSENSTSEIEQGMCHKWESTDMASMIIPLMIRPLSHLE